MSKIWYRNIHAFLRNRNFRAGTFLRFTLYTLTGGRSSELRVRCGKVLQVPLLVDISDVHG